MLGEERKEPGANTDTAVDYDIDPTQYTKIIFKLPEGNPNIA